MYCVMKYVDKLNEWVGRVMSVFPFFIVGALMVEIGSRYVFNKPNMWSHETSEHLFGGLILLIGGYVLRYRAHINMDILYNRLGPRGKAILDLVSSPLFFVFVGVLLWKGGEMAWTSLMMGERTNSFWGPPMYPLKMTIPVGAFLLLAQGIVNFIRSLEVAITGMERP